MSAAFSPGGSAPAENAETVSKSDTVDLVNISRGIWCGGAGNLAVIMAGNAATITFVGVPAGTLVPVRVTRVMSTNTTATSMVSVW